MNSKNIFFIITILGIIILGGSALIKGDSQGQGIFGGNGNTIQGDTQTVKMYVSGGSYVFEPSEFTVGRPVKIVADIARMPGCSKSIVIPAFGIQKTLTTQDNIISFTPTKAGTFNIACTMNMYKGTFTVVESDGSKSNYVDTSAPTGSSCGSDSGGCGCGGAR